MTTRTPTPPRTTPPRRTCPACARRYAGLIAADCPVCSGLGVLTLGAAALHHHEAPAVARAVELYLEHHAGRTADTLPLGQHRPALRAAVDELRVAGVLASSADATGERAHQPRTVVSPPRVVELDAHRLAKQLGAATTITLLEALKAGPGPLARARPSYLADPATWTSANGHRAHLSRVADPVDPLGPDGQELEHTRGAHTHAATVIAAAVPTVVRRRTRTAATA